MGSPRTYLYFFLQGLGQGWGNIPAYWGERDHKRKVRNLGQVSGLSLGGCLVERPGDKRMSLGGGVTWRTRMGGLRVHR